MAMNVFCVVVLLFTLLIFKHSLVKKHTLRNIYIWYKSPIYIYIYIHIYIYISKVIRQIYNVAINIDISSLEMYVETSI